MSMSIHTIGLCPSIFFYYFSLSLLYVYTLVLWAGVLGVIGCMSLSLSDLYCRPLSIIIIIIIMWEASVNDAVGSFSK